MARRKRKTNEQYLPPAIRRLVKEEVSKEVANKLRYGANMNRRLEGYPRPVQFEGDHMIKAMNNQYVKLHRDTFGYGVCDPSEGTAASGRMGVGAISMVVGGGKTKRGDTNPSHDLAGPNYAYQNTERDSAFIIMSEYTARGIDKACGLGDHTPYSWVGSPSGIGMKADTLALVGRSGVTICGGRTEKRNSAGALIASLPGITLLGADSKEPDIQPLVKGDNLVMGLKRLNAHILDLSGIVLGFLTSQIIYNTAIMGHTHFSPFYALPTTPSTQCFVAGASTVLYQTETSWLDDLYNKCNLTMWQLEYLTDAGTGFINSRHNDTT